MLHLHRRNGIWHVRGRVDGKDISRTLETRNKVLAQCLMDKLEKELRLGHTQVTWEEFVEAFKTNLATRDVADNTRKKYLFVVDRFTAYVQFQGYGKVRHVATDDVVDAYLVERTKDMHPTRGTPMGREGLKSDQRILRLLFNLAVKKKLIDENPLKDRNLNSRPGKAQPFTDEEVERMLEFANRGGSRDPMDLRAVVWVFINTGFRVSDVITFPKSAIQGDWINVETTKRKKQVRLPLLPNTKEALQQWRESCNEEQLRSPWVFSTCTGKQIRNLDAYLRRMWVQAGIEGAHVHRFRHTFAVRMLRNGSEIHDVARALGISVAVCERHYAKFCPELRERVQRLVRRLSNVVDPAE